MDLIHKIESLRYDIENGVETDVIKISVRLIQIKDQALQLQQTGVSGCFSKEEVVNIILEFTNIALHSNSHNLTREELRELLRVAKNGWLNNR